MRKFWKYGAVLVRFGVYFDQIVSWKLIYFYIKNNYYSYSFAMRYSYSSLNFFGETCHNSCVLVYILIAFWMKKWFFSNRNNDISCTHARGHATLRENFEKMCNLMRLGEYFVLNLFFLKVISFYKTIWYMLMGFQGIFPMNKYEI